MTMTIPRQRALQFRHHDNKKRNSLMQSSSKRRNYIYEMTKKLMALFFIVYLVSRLYVAPLLLDLKYANHKLARIKDVNTIAGGTQMFPRIRERRLETRLESSSDDSIPDYNDDEYFSAYIL